MIDGLGFRALLGKGHPFIASPVLLPTQTRQLKYGLVSRYASESELVECSS